MQLADLLQEDYRQEVVPDTAAVLAEQVPEALPAGTAQLVPVQVVPVELTAGTGAVGPGTAEVQPLGLPANTEAAPDMADQVRYIPGLEAGDRMHRWWTGLVLQRPH